MISSTTRTAGPYSGNGSQTVFPFAFKVFQNSDVLVVQTDATGNVTNLALTSNYTVALNVSQDTSPGGTVTMVIAPSTGYLITLTSQVPLLQTTDLTNAGNFYPKAINNSLDYLTILIQQLYTSVLGALRFPIGDPAANNTLPSAAARANNLLGFDALGNPITVAPTSGTATALQSLLSSTTGSGLIGYAAADGSPVASTVAARLSYLDGVSPPTTAADNGSNGAVNAYRNATAITGGTSGYTNSAIYAQTNTGVNEVAYEWVMSAVLHNLSATTAQNVAVAGTAYKHAGAGTTWAGFFQSIDDSGVVNPTSTQIGVEIDTFATGLDNNLQRVQLAIGTSSTATISRGITLGSNTGFYSIGANFYGNQVTAIAVSNTGVVGVDVSGGTHSGGSIRLAQSQKISFDTSDVSQLNYNGSSLQYTVLGAQKAAFNNDGSISLNGAVTKFMGTVSTAAVAPVLTANKPGASTAVGTWMSVMINGVQYWVPAWSN